MLLDETHETLSLQVFDGEREVHMHLAGVPPRTVVIAGSQTSTFNIEPKSAEFTKSLRWELPLSSYDTAQFAAHPPVEIFDRFFDFRQAEIRDPSPDYRVYFADHGTEVTAPATSTSQDEAVLSRYGVARAWSQLVDGHEYAMKSVIQRLRFPLEVMLVCVRWYVAYPLSLRNLEEIMQERGVTVDHSTIHRWTLRLMPVLERTFRKRKAIVGKSWRMDETYIKVGGQWKYLYRAVDKAGNTVDFLLTAKRDRAAAQRFLTRAIGNNALPTTITIDQSGANTAGIESYNVEHDTAITIRQCKYRNNIVEQDHRAVKRQNPTSGNTITCAKFALSQSPTVERSSPMLD